MTSRLRLGTGICLVIQHDPIVTAKEVATLDLLSNGRFLFGVGAGWNVEEIENHGTAFPTRFRVMRERVLAMKEIWTKDEAEFHGEFVRFDPIWSYPKPVQSRTRPSSSAARGRTRCGGSSSSATAGSRAGGREPTRSWPSWRTCGLRPRAPGATRRPSRSPCSAGRRTPPVLDRYRAAGIDRVVLPLPSEGRERILPLLDQYARPAPLTRSGQARDGPPQNRDADSVTSARAQAFRKRASTAAASAVFP